MKKIVLVFLVILMVISLSNFVFADDLVIYKSNFQGQVTQGYHLINEDCMKQEVYYNDDSIVTQSDLFEKMFTTLYGDPEKSKIENIIILRWIIDGKEIFLKKDENFMIIQISDTPNAVP